MRLMFPVGMTFLDNSGVPLVGAKIYTSPTGVAFATTAKATYTDVAGGTTLPNPILTDAYGRLTYNGNSTAVWGAVDTAYRLVLKDSTDVQIVSADNITGTFDPTYQAWVSHNVQFATDKGLYDDSGNEQLLLTKTTSAVNFLNVTNAATSGAVIVAAKGDDTNIALSLKSKGSSLVTISNDSSYNMNAYHFIGSATASASAVITFTDLSTNYYRYILELEAVLPATDGTDLYLRLSSNNGSSYIATGYRGTYSKDDGTTYAKAAAVTTSFILSKATGNVGASGEGVWGSVSLINPMVNTTGVSMFSNIVNVNQSSIPEVGLYMGQYPTAGVYNAFELFFSSGNITSGKFKLYGIRIS